MPPKSLLKAINCLARRPALQAASFANARYSIHSHCNQSTSLLRQLKLSPSTPSRRLSTSTISCVRAGPVDFEENIVPKRKNFKENLLPDEWMRLVDKYPDFVPHPMHRSLLLVHKQLDFMLARRAVLDIPEFYVGSILAVTVSDQYSDTKRSRFVGICTHRTGQLTSAQFTLRNVIDGMGVEIAYDLYNPLILSIEVLRLEKRLDDWLLYLRDALPEYSTFPEDMRPEIPEEGAEVPVNKLRVKMKPRPWTRKWELFDFKGIEVLEQVPEWFVNKAKAAIEDPVYSYDLMYEYRMHCTEETMYGICKRLADHEKNVVQPRKDAKLKRFIRVAKSPIGKGGGKENATPSP